MEEFGVPRTSSPEPFEPGDYPLPSSPILPTSTATTTATAKATGSISRADTGRRATNTNGHVDAEIFTYPPNHASTSTQQPHSEEPKPPVPSSSEPAVPPPRHWHPKLTLYRLLVILTTLAFGISKAVLSYKGFEIIPITLEWLFGTGVFLLFFSLDTYSSRTHRFAWFFDLDLNYLLYARICATFGYPNPRFYATQEVERRPSMIEAKHPPIRGYDLLVMALTAAVGMTKGVLAYQGQDTAATSMDWAGGVVVGLSLYWLGLYESNPIGLMPYLFTTDYSSDIKENMTVRTPFRVIPQLPIIALAGYWTYKCTKWAIFLAHIFDAEMKNNMQGDAWMLNAVMSWVMFPCFTVAYVSACATGMGIGICIVGVVVLSGFRVGRYRESASLIWSYAAPILRLTSFYIFFIFTLFPTIAMMIPLTPILFEAAYKDPILYLSIVLVLGGTGILVAMLAWLLRRVWWEVGGGVRRVVRVVMRAVAGFGGWGGGGLGRRGRGASMGV